MPGTHHKIIGWFWTISPLPSIQVMFPIILVDLNTQHVEYLRFEIRVAPTSFWVDSVTRNTPHISAGRYDDIYRMEEIKSLSFHIMFCRLFRGVAKYIVYGKTFSSFEWLWSLYAAHHETWRETERAQNQELVTKRGTTSVACSRVFKHCSLKQTQTTELYACASLSVWEERFFFSADFEQLHKHTYMRQNPRLCKYPR